MSAPTLAGVRVLIADDVPSNLTVLLDFLQEAGAKVFVAEDGAGALEQLGAARPDIVLLDVMMPRLDGLETCRRLKALPAHAGTPVIFMSALTDPVDKVRGFAAGAADFVSKPLHPAEVLARVAAHVTLHRLQRELQAQNGLLAAEVKRRQAAEEQLKQSLDRAVIVAGGEGEVLFVTRRAEQLLADYFPATEPGALPADLQRVIAQGAAEVFSRGEAGLRVRPFVERAEGGCATLLLEETAPVGAPERLQILGLTAREAEMLFWVAQGKANAEVASILGTSPNTVKKHLQSIMPKLGVESRLAAALRAREVLQIG
jgi:DNA-binding response OmpR family regulator/DNA-binding CsgD family transcriptional regulator